MKLLKWILILIIAFNSAYYIYGSLLEVFRYKLNYLSFIASLPAHYIFFHILRTLLSIVGLGLFYKFIRRKEIIGKLVVFWWTLQLFKIYRMRPGTSGKLAEISYFDLITGFSIKFGYSPSIIPEMTSKGALFISVNIIAVVGLILSFILISYRRSNSAGTKSLVAE